MFKFAFYHNNNNQVCFVLAPTYQACIFRSLFYCSSRAYLAFNRSNIDTRDIIGLSIDDIYRSKQNRSGYNVTKESSGRVSSDSTFIHDSIELIKFRLYH